jgi:hypothetical protein
MPKQIKGIQRKGQYAGSTKGYSDYDDWSTSEEFIVKKLRYEEKVSVELFFPRLTNPKEGVGLEMPSPEVAIAVGRALLTVADGCADEVTVRF